MYETVFSQLQQAGEQWKKLADDQMSRARAVAAEVSKLQEKGNEQATLWIDEWAKLAKGWVAYTAQLSAEWQKLAFPATSTNGNGEASSK
jgi:hypothetical protein